MCVFMFRRLNGSCDMGVQLYMGTLIKHVQMYKQGRYQPRGLCV